ncbi:glycoside hydrolase family 104 protein, partial [Acinetobacter baumannii]
MATRENFEKLLSSPNVQKMLNLIANAEGVEHGYNTLFGNERLNDLSWHPNVKKEFTQTDGKKNVTTAAGRYQFLKDTWDGVAKQLGLKDFSPKNQDIAAVALLAQNGALPSVLKGDFKTAVQKSGSTWASLPSSPYAQPKRSWKELGINNPAREQYETKASDIVAAYKKKQQEQEAKAQPKADSGRAQRIIDAYQKARQNGQIKDSATQPQGLPDFDQNGVITYEQPQAAPKQPEPSLADKALGLGETALSAATGATGGTLGMLGGTLGQAGREILAGNFGTPEAAQRISQNAAEGAADLTYAPRTQTGQEYTQALGEISEPLVALTPALSELALAGQAARGVSPIAQGQAIRTAQAVAPVVERAGQAAQRPIQATANAVRSGAQRVGEMVGMRTPEAEGSPASSMGAAETGQEQIRRNLFQEFDVPATNPQITRSPEQLKDFYETIRGGGEAGQLLRDRIEEQSRAVETALHKAIDDTGAKASDVYTTGESITKALENQMNVESVNVRKKYAAADASKEAERKVDLAAPVEWTKQELADADEKGITLDQGNVVDLINQNQGLKSTGVYSDAKTLAIKRGIADVNEDGDLVAKTGDKAPTLKQIEDWRKEIRSTINQNENADIAAGTRIINMIDNATSRVEGNLYKEARKARYDFAKRWETRSIITDLVKNKKNSDDRKVALENIVDRITSTKTSKEDIAFIRKIMNESGEDGKQAWKDTQGTIINNIREQAFSGVQDTRGNETLLASKMDNIIKKLDAAGKLDDIFDKPQAERLRGLNELTKTMLTLPPQMGINWSNTAKAVLAGIADLVLFGMTGMPPVVASALRLAVKHIQDRKALIRAKRMLDVNLPKGKS